MINLVGKFLGRYRIDEVIGEGGMAVVYKAFDTRLDRYVAIKVVVADSENSEEFLKRFEREAKALAKLSHPNIVDVHDYGEQDGMPYLVMEYLPGGTLKQKLGKPFYYIAASKMLIPVASALAYAHRLKIVHRDVKPANILLTETGQPMLSDFGIAKVLSEGSKSSMTGTGVGIGTPDYMAPEQGVGMKIDHRVDIYSLGVVFYELVTGRKPFQAKNPMAVLLKHVSDPFPSPRATIPDLPVEVERIIFRAVEKKPDDRYQEMDMFQTAMDDLVTRAKRSAEGLSERLSQPVPAQPEQRPGLRRPIVLDQKSSFSARMPVSQVPAAKVPGTQVPAASVPSSASVSVKPPREEPRPAEVPKPEVPAAQVPAEPAPAVSMPAENIPPAQVHPEEKAPVAKLPEEKISPESVPVSPAAEQKLDTPTPPTPVSSRKLERAYTDSSIPIQAAQLGTVIKVCPNCQTAITPGDKVCSHCGAKIPDELLIPEKPLGLSQIQAMPAPECAQEPSTADEWLLVVATGALSGTCFKLGSAIGLGRSKENEIKLSEINVSRRHARIERQGSGYQITDLNSSNGTFVNGARITQPTPIHPNDVILLGDTYIKVQGVEKTPEPVKPSKPVPSETVRHPKKKDAES